MCYLEFIINLKDYSIYLESSSRSFAMFAKEREKMLRRHSMRSKCD
jgi:hypothetical protein